VKSVPSTTARHEMGPACPPKRRTIKLPRPDMPAVAGASSHISTPKCPTTKHTPPVKKTPAGPRQQIEPTRGQEKAPPTRAVTVEGGAPATLGRSGVWSVKARVVGVRRSGARRVFHCPTCRRTRLCHTATLAAQVLCATPAGAGTARKGRGRRTALPCYKTCWA
jgi:hypothetical protein